MSASQIKSGEQILNSWPLYRPTYAINSLIYEKYELSFCVMDVNSGPRSQQVGYTLNCQILLHFSLYTKQTEQFDKNVSLFEI